MADMKREVQELIRKNSPRISFVANNGARARSKAWDQFQYITIDGTYQPFVACKDCLSVHVWTKRDGTSGLIHHNCGTLKKINRRQSTLTSYAKQLSDQLAKVKRQIAVEASLCAAQDLRPYMFVEGAGMLSLAQALMDASAKAAERGHRLKAEQVLPSAVTVGREVRHQAELAREELKAKLSEDMETCAVTTDGWVDPYRHVSYICVTAHFLDKKFNLRSTVLGTRIMERDHTGADIFAEVSSVLEEFVPEWQQEKRVAAFVTDNAANVNSTFRDLEESGVWFGCACHNLNLAVKQALDIRELNNDSVLNGLAVQIANTKALVTLVRRKGLNRHLERSLKMEVETRWNSMLAMVRSVVEAIPQMTRLPQFQSGDVAKLVSNVNATMLKRLVSVLAPLEEATKHLSGQLYPTIHLVAPTKENLARQLKVVPADDPVTRRLKKRLLTALDAKFTVNDVHLMAALLWPPHRDLAIFTQTISEEQRKQATSDLVKHATDLSGSGASAQERTPPSPADGGPCRADSLTFFSFETEEETASDSDISNQPRSAATEVRDYQAAPGPVGKHITEDILGYWSAEATQARFPALCRVARRFLAVPAASTGSERTCSESGRILEERRSSLHPESVDALVFLNSRGKANDE